jgi:hypothetical protein
MTAKPEALVPWAGGEAGREHDTVADEGATGGAYGTDTAPQKSSTDGKRVLEALLRETVTMDGREHELEALSQGTPTEREHKRALPT